MPKGRATNRNPSPATRFGAGVSGNPIGKTSEQRQAEIRNAWLATKIRGQFLEALETILDAPTSAEAMANLEIAATRMRTLGPDTLRLLKDSEDRGLGTPTGSVAISNPDGSLRPEPVKETVKELLQAIHAKPDAG